MSKLFELTSGNWASPTKKKWFLAILILITVIDILFFNNVLELRAEEPRRAIVSFEMYETGNWIVPHIHNEAYYNKPPLFNWIQGFFMWVFGNSEWSVRLTGALSFIFTSYIVFYVLKKITSKEVALFGAFAYITTIDLLYYGSVNTGEIDLFYSLVILLHALVIFRYHQREEYLKLFLWSYLLTAVGFLTKGIPSLAFQAITLLAYFTITKRFFKLISWQHITGIILLFSIIGSSLYLYDQEANVLGFLARQFKETSQRSANEFGLLAILLQFIQFPFFVLSKLLPWSLLIMLYAFKPIRTFVWNNPILKYCTVFTLANIFIYWISPDVRVRYIYMFFPFLIILFVAPFDKIDWARLKLKQFITYPILTLLTLISLGVIILPYIIHLTTPVYIISATLLGGIILFLAIALYHQIKTFSGLWILIFSLLIIRLSYNILILPIQHKNSTSLVYREILTEMIDRTGQNQIYLSGNKQIIESNISLLGKDFTNIEVQIPPTIPYQVPYYYAKYTGKILKYKQNDLEPGLYLAFETDKDSSKIEIIYRFYAENKKRYMIVYQPK